MKHHTCTRLLSLVLAVVMALLLLSVAAFAADVPAYAHLEIGTASGQPGETVKIPIYIKGIQDDQRCRGFDTTVVLGENLTLKGAEWTDLVSGFDYKICNKDSGYLTANDMMNRGFRITANGKLCDLLVKIADDATTVGTISLTKVSISGETSEDFLNSTDGRMSGRDLSAVVTPTDENGASVPIISIKQTASFTMGKQMPGLAIVLDEVDQNENVTEQYAVLTVSFGDFLTLKNSAFIDTNNCPFAPQLLTDEIAQDTGHSKISGYCEYPLWVFKEDFLKEIGGEKYEQYSEQFDAYMRREMFEDDMKMDEMRGM